MRKKRVAKRIVTLLTAAAIGVGTFAGLPTTAKAADNAGIRSFVTRMYEVCLDREPDTDGLNDWSNRLATGQAQGADIAFGFIFSEEFKNLNLCNEHYVDSMYSAFFGREADAAGKADWVGQLNSGATRGHVMTGFVNSQEFANLCASYGINQGSGDWSADNISVNGTCSICANGGNSGNSGSREVTPEMRAFAERLYTCCLDREADENGLNDWANALANGATGSEVAAGFVFSQEYKNKDASDTQYVLMLYKTMLGREADTYGVTDWVLRLRNGASREAVYNGFIGSTEFANLCQNAGITVGSAIADNGTTGRQSTGEKVNAYLAEYVNGEYGRTSYIGQPTEGQLIDLTGSYESFTGSNAVHTETEPFIAYEGAVGKINYVGDITLDFLN